MGAIRMEEKDIQNVEMRTGAPWRPHSEKLHHASDLSRLFLIPSLLPPEQTSQTTLVWETVCLASEYFHDPTWCNLTHIPSYEDI